MSEQARACPRSDDCLQYCQALDSIGGFSFGPNGSDCQWPEQLEEVDFGTGEDGMLLKMLSSKLASVLKDSNEDEQFTADVERGYEAIDGIFQRQLASWKHRAQALAEGRSVTDVEAIFFGTQLKTAQQDAVQITEGIEGRALTVAQARHDRMTLGEHRLLFDERTNEIVDRLVDNVTHGRHTLLVGDKGIAKTKMAEFVTTLFSGDKEITVISGHGSMMSDELVGKVDLVEGQGTVFHEGKLIKCMREGRPLVLDEVNLADQQIMMRLQDILLKRPGQSVILQENGNEPIVIQPGFCVIATANEASARYHAREQLDPAFRDRFDVIKVEYPDNDIEHLTAMPSTNIRLALAHTITDSGRELPHVSAMDAVTLARLAHATQRLYSQPSKNVAGDLIDGTSDLLDDEEPLLTDCITPRKMVTIMERVATGTSPRTTVASETERALEALDQYGDRNKGFAGKILEKLKDED